ncbi:MAG: MarR family transcriptional regulator [Treponema sp.]|nr:MarR family transcriptional regulator [Treponema sp.]
MLEILENTCILLAKAEQVHLQCTRNRFLQEGLDITPVQWLVLYTLYKKDGESITQLAKRCYLDNATITGVIDRLEKAGYVSREPLEGDRRVYKIFLQPRAHEIKEKVIQITNSIFAEMIEACTNEEITIFRKVLLNIFEKLSNKE